MGFTLLLNAVGPTAAVVTGGTAPVVEHAAVNAVAAKADVEKLFEVHVHDHGQSSDTLKAKLTSSRLKPTYG